MDSTQIGLEIAKLLVTAFASGVATYYAIRIAASQRDIAARQAGTANAARKVAEGKLNLDLFEERYAVFEKLWQFLSHPVDHSEPKYIGGEFTNLIPKAQFLFGNKIADYMREASSEQIELVASLNKYKQMPGDKEASQKILALERLIRSKVSSRARRKALTRRYARLFMGCVGC